MKLLYIVNVDWFFLSHRLPIALEALNNSFEVHLALQVTEHKSLLQSYGFIVHPIIVKRGRFSIFFDFLLILNLIKILLNTKPNIIHLVTIKPIIFGGIISKILKIKSIVYSVTGLGFVFVDDGFLSKIRRLIVKTLYKFAFRNKFKKVIFQNKSDQSFLTNLLNLNYEDTVLIPGSGVDLKKFKKTNLPQRDITFTMVSRLIKEKGVWEFVSAAKIISNKYSNSLFVLVGSPDFENPSSLSKKDLEKIKTTTSINVLGERKDIDLILQKSHVIVLPSYYGEGVPKVLLEAAASARAVITTDIPGCRDTIIVDQSGYLVPPKNISALIEKMENIIQSPGRLINFGKKGRELAEKKFDINIVIREHMKIYNNFFKAKK